MYRSRSCKTEIGAIKDLGLLVVVMRQAITSDIVAPATDNRTGSCRDITLLNYDVECTMLPSCVYRVLAIHF